MFENMIFLISFSWASIAGSLVNMDSLFTISPPPHLCLANQPVGHMELFMLKALATPQARLASDKCATHLLGRALPQIPLVFLGQNPHGLRDNPQGRLQGEEGVFPEGIGQTFRWLEGCFGLPIVCCVTLAILFPSLASPHSS